MQPMTLFYKFYKRFSRQKYLIVFIYLLFVIILAIVLPFIRNLDALNRFCLFLSAVWSIVGPCLIVRYYQKFQSVMMMLSDNQLLFENSKLMNSFKDNYNINKIVCAIWVPMLSSVLVLFPQSLEFLSIFGHTDPLYWLFLIFTLLLLYFTATGFSGVISSILLAFNLNQKLDNNTYLLTLINQDREGFEKLTEFFFATSSSFSAGVCLIPILLIYMNYSNSLLVRIIVSVAIILYSFCIFLSYIIPMGIIKNNIKKYRNNKINPIKEEYDIAVLDSNHLKIISLYVQLQQTKEEILLLEALEKTLQVVILAILPILVQPIINFFVKILGL